MASRIGSLIQDQNLNIPYNGASVGGKSNVVKPQKKGGLGGRKPLGDLSNTGSKQAHPKNFAFVKEVVTTSSKVTTQDASNNKKNGYKSSDKAQSGSRKALSDISNPGKPNLQQEASKKKQNVNVKKLGCILEEGFLHNHQECINAQTRRTMDLDMDMDQFLNTIGLKSVSVSSKREQFVASPRAPRTSRNLEPENSLWHLELKEINEDFIEDKYCWKQMSPPPCETPKSPNYHSSIWNDSDIINFRLMETP